MTYINPDSIVNFATSVGADIKSLKARVTAVETSGGSNPAPTGDLDMGSITDTSTTTVYDMGTLS
jgi:hypothetical protein